MKKLRLDWIILSLVSSVLLSAGFASAAEKLDPQSKALEVKTPNQDQPAKGSIPCVVPCVHDYYND